MNIKINNKKQSGAVLLVSMVILVALTMLGVTSMKSSLSELTMAGNLRESGLTFQAAEAGLKTAERLVEDSVTVTLFDGSNSLLNESNVDPDYLAKASWTSASESNVVLKNIGVKPKYIIRYLGERDSNAKANIALGGYGRNQSGTVISNFRVTSRGSGQTGNFYRVVQSYYAKEY